MGWLIFLLILTIIAFSCEWYLLGGILAAFWVIILMIIIVISINNDQEKKEEAERKEKRKAEREAHLAELKSEYDKYTEERLALYGEPTNVITIEPNDIHNQIVVYESHNLISIMGKDYKMTDVLSCTYTDSSYVKKGEVSYETITDNGSMLGRAAVGGALLGATGAIIGGSTAKTNTTVVSQGNDVTIHNYTVLINMDSLSEPIIKIYLGKKAGLVNEIVGLMNVIARRNQKL